VVGLIWATCGLLGVAADAEAGTATAARPTAAAHSQRRVFGEGVGRVFITGHDPARAPARHQYRATAPGGRALRSRGGREGQYSPTDGGRAALTHDRSYLKQPPRGHRSSGQPAAPAPTGQTAAFHANRQ
jgi:hypothetical protein